MAESLNPTPVVVRKLLVSLVVASMSWGVVTAQEPSAGDSTSPKATFTSGVDAVTVTVSVRDARGRIVRDLSVKDFTVLDAGAPVTIKDFYAGDASVSLAILLDISGSMEVGRNIDRARDAVSVAMMSLRDQTDEAALFTFDSELREIVAFTSNLEHIQQMGLKGKPWGQTSLYDAIADAATAVAARANRHRALLVITDGVDTGSHLTAPEVSGIASSIDVPVYLLTVATPLDHPGEHLAVESDARAETTATLADLSRWTGGEMRVASTPAHTSTAVNDILSELRHQYLISFEPGERTGWHPIEVRTRRRGLVVRARGGYQLSSSGPGS